MAHKYRVVNGTSYDANTSPIVINALEHARTNNIRVIIDYGDIKTGKSWNEIHDISGYVGRSSGQNKIPLLIYNKRSFGGGSILTNCILSIKYANKKDGEYIYKQ